MNLVESSVINRVNIRTSNPWLRTVHSLAARCGCWT